MAPPAAQDHEDRHEIDVLDERARSKTARESRASRSPRRPGGGRAGHVPESNRGASLSWRGSASSSSPTGRFRRLTAKDVVAFIDALETRLNTLRVGCDDPRERSRDVSAALTEGHSYHPPLSRSLLLSLSGSVSVVSSVRSWVIVRVRFRWFSFGCSVVRFASDVAFAFVCLCDRLTLPPSCAG